MHVNAPRVMRFVALAVLFAAVGLAFTALSLAMAPVATKVGTLRSLATIPLHEAELVAVGLAIGLLASAASRRPDPLLILLPVAFVSLLDLDHLPAALGVAQPIRPAHSVFFLAAFVACLLLLRQPPEIGVLSIAAFLGHLGVDTGVFPLLFPLSLHYYSLTGYRVALVASAFVVALAAGSYSRSRRTKMGSPPHPDTGRLPSVPESQAG